MKNYFCTELGFEGFMPESHTNLRALEVWIKYLDAYHLNIFNTLASDTTYGGICWLVIPKGTKAVNMLFSLNPNIVHNLKTKFDKVYCIQEGETTWWAQFDVKTQIWIYNQFFSSDRIYTQNEYDARYLRGIYPNVPIHIILPVMDESIIDSNNFVEKTELGIIAGPMIGEYLGFNSSILFKNLQIPFEVPPMASSRMPADSYHYINAFDGSYLNYMMWLEWIYNLSKYKYGMFMVDAIGAATFPMNLGYFGIPCVGDNRADTQKNIFPDLSVDYLDYESAFNKLKLLKSDPIFYKDVSDKSIELYKSIYNKDNFLKTLDL